LKKATAGELPASVLARAYRHLKTGSTAEAMLKALYRFASDQFYVGGRHNTLTGEISGVVGF
jgi:hypothetical protein